MNISLKITDSIKTVERNVNTSIASAINEKIEKNLSRINNSCKVLIRKWILMQPEIQSLLSKTPFSLRALFGIPTDTQIVVDSIISSIMNATEIKFVKYSNNLSGGLELRFQPKTFANLVSLPQGSVVYKNGVLNWIDWLLKRGDSIIVVNYQYSPLTGLGRSGLGIMETGGSFRVPPQFSGTEENNFVTRAFLGKMQESDIIDLIKRILES